MAFVSKSWASTKQQTWLCLAELEVSYEIPSTFDVPAGCWSSSILFLCVFFSVPYQTSSLSSGWTNALIDKTKMAKVQSSAVGPIITVGILGIKCIEMSTIAILPTFHQTLSHLLQLTPPSQRSNLRMRSETWRTSAQRPFKRKACNTVWSGHSNIPLLNFGGLLGNVFNSSTVLKPETGRQKYFYWGAALVNAFMPVGCLPAECRQSQYTKKTEHKSTTTTTSRRRRRRRQKNASFHPPGRFAELSSFLMWLSRSFQQYTRALPTNFPCRWVGR